MKRHTNSVNFALAGVFLAIAREQNFRLQWFLGTAVFLFMAFFGFAQWQEAVLLLLVFLVLAFELLNSAVENVADFSGKEFNYYKKRAKDFAAASVLLASFGAGLVFTFFISENLQNFNYIPLTIPFITIGLISLATGTIASLISPSKASLSLVTIFGINLVVLGFLAPKPQWLVLCFFMLFFWIIADVRAKRLTKDPVA